MSKGYLFISNSTKPTPEQASITTHKVNTFALAPIEAAHKLGFKIYEGLNCSVPEKVIDQDFDITFYDQHTYRSIFAIKDNWVAYKNLMRFLKAHPDIEVIHCNTPIGGVMGRVCGKLCGVKKIIYTAHGFHFFKGAPLFNNTVLKWIELFLAHWTDVLITMNEDDFQAAKNFKLRDNGKVFKVHGVGVYTKQYDDHVDRVNVRRELGLPDDAIMCIAMGDVVARKNYKIAIEAIAHCKNTNLHYIICGNGDQIQMLQEYAKKLNVEKQVHFLGFRTDIKALSLASDFFLFASLQEGLPRSTMEAMCAGLPCVVSNIRGNNDLIDDCKGGYLADPLNSIEFADAINKIIKDKNLSSAMGEYNKEKIKQFDIDIVKNEILEIYKEVL